MQVDKIETIQWIECYIPFVYICNKINRNLVWDTRGVTSLDSLVQEGGMLSLPTSQEKRMN